MTNWAKVNRNMAGFAANMQNIYKARKATADNKAESAEDTKTAIKGVYEDEFKRINDLVGYYDKLIKDSKEGGIYGEEESNINEFSKKRSIALNKKLALLENGVNLVDPKTMQVAYNETTQPSRFNPETGEPVSVTGLGTQLKDKEALDMAVDFINVEKALGVDKRRQMFRQATPVIKELTKLRIKKAKWNTWNANDIIVRGGNEKTKEVYDKWRLLFEKKRSGELKTEKELAEFEKYDTMQSKGLIFDDKNEQVSVDSLFPNYTKIKRTHKDDKPETFTDSDMSEAEVYNKLIQKIVRLNDPSLSEDQISNLNFLDLNANSEEMKAYIDLMFDDTVPSKINEVMDRLEEAIERRE
jgi:hypothetical protein